MNRANHSAGGQSAYTAQSSAAATSTEKFAHFAPLQRQIMQFIVSQPKSDEGIHVAAIARHVATTMGQDQGSAESIRSVILSTIWFRQAKSFYSQALDHLMDQGHVYSTIDDSHFSVSE